MKIHLYQCFQDLAILFCKFFVASVSCKYRLLYFIWKDIISWNVYLGMRINLIQKVIVSSLSTGLLTTLLTGLTIHMNKKNRKKLLNSCHLSVSVDSLPAQYFSYIPTESCDKNFKEWLWWFISLSVISQFITSRPQTSSNGRCTERGCTSWKDIQMNVLEFCSF